MELLLIALLVLALGVPVGRFAPRGGGLALLLFVVLVVAGTWIGATTADGESEGLGWGILIVSAWFGCALLIGGYLVGLFGRVFVWTCEDEF